jgi:ABC-type branched-subunit amino acid transport system substrate-binding protein
MLRRAFLLLAGTAGLAGCTTYPPPGAYYGAPGTLAPGQSPGQRALGPGGKVAILLPLSGPHSDLGQPLLQAAQLALQQPGSPALISQDTSGSPEGAAQAARTVLAGGAGMILGPLTAPEVSAAAPIARGAQVPMLAFSNDPAIAQAGVWPLGITPGQQVGRLVAAGQQAGKSRWAALLPDTDFGRVMGSALSQAAAAAGLQSPDIRFHGSGMGPISQAVRQLSDYDARWAPIQDQIRAARAQGTAEGRRRAQELSASVLPPPPFDALLLADTGEALTELAAVLPYYFVTQPAVQFMGPALWADPRSGAGQFRGAWYAAPDPSARANFVSAYSARYGAPPPTVADIAFDAASIARVSATSRVPLTNPAGFSGADGWLALLANGQVRRGLAVFQVGPGGGALIQPAPTGASGA